MQHHMAIPTHPPFLLEGGKINLYVELLDL